MSIEVFADTQFFIALANPHDSWRAATLSAMSKVSETIVTTEFVLMEVGDALSRTGERQRFKELLTKLDNEAQVIVLPASHVLFREASELHAARLDKEWSLTDCSSFIVMQHRGIQKSLTGDHHFTQAGFEVLIKPND
ncbi:MAG: PIN domain-containing protein [Gemmatales bacterium]